jgi:hypothetical protein
MCWVIPAYIGLVDREGVAHRLTLQAFDEGLEAGTGQFVAACERTLLAASLFTQARSRCPECAEITGGALGRVL